jgi:tRNA 2-thiouridine synthesizing protein E
MPVKGRAKTDGMNRRRRLNSRPRAEEKRLDLTPAHLEVIRFLQAYASEHESVPDARELANVLVQHFERQGGRNYLYRLFPKGPVTQASKLAGLEIPTDGIKG